MNAASVEWERRTAPEVGEEAGPAENKTVVSEAAAAFEVAINSFATLRYYLTSYC